MFTWDSALRVSGCRFARVAASSGSGCLPCPSAPLQSITAVASRRLPVPGPADGVVRGARSPSTRVACCASGSRAEARGPAVVSPEGEGQANVFAADCAIPSPKRWRRARLASPSTAEAMCGSAKPLGVRSLSLPAEAGRSLEPTVRRSPHFDDPPKWIASARHAAGRRRHLPWGSAPFGEISPGGPLVPACLTDTFRPQGFSPSRRLTPTRASWLCFTPLPPLGFWPSELFPLGQP
jgi:hypothetical protein